MRRAARDRTPRAGMRANDQTTHRLLLMGLANAEQPLEIGGSGSQVLTSGRRDSDFRWPPWPAPGLRMAGKAADHVGGWIDDPQGAAVGGRDVLPRECLRY